MSALDRRRIATLLALAAAFAAPGFVAAQSVIQVTDERTTTSGPGAMDDAGTVLFAGSSADFAGENPDHAFQIIRFDPATGSATPVTSVPGGTAAVLSVSDDGQWLAFPTVADLTGGNHDESVELFVMRDDGSEISQLTSDPLPNAGSVGSAALSGDGSRLAFVSNSDLTGDNPDRIDQLFVIRRDGSDLVQRTHATEGSFGVVSISDDGERVAFTSSADLGGINPDLTSELYVVDADGTSAARQLTSVPAGFTAGMAALSGNGARIAFQSDADLTGGNTTNQTEIFVIDWEGTGLAQLTQTSTVLGITGDPASQLPTITDDGQTIYFTSNESSIFPPLNSDGNFEIFRIGADGTGLTAVTSTVLDGGSLFPVVAGNGGRVAYYGVGASISLETMDGDGGNVVDLLVFDPVQIGQPELTPDGSRALVVRADGLFGAAEIWRIDDYGSDPFPVTSLGAPGTSSPSIAADRQTIVFASDTNALGFNVDLSDEIFSIAVDGSGLAQLTSGAAGTTSANPVISEDGSTVVFDSDADLTGGNPDGSREIYVMAIDGSGLVQLTDGPTGTGSRLPRIDAAGDWLVFESDADLDGTSTAIVPSRIHRMRSDGTDRTAITSGAIVAAHHADISADGNHVVFEWAADPLGMNPEQNTEIFAYDATTATLSQLTAIVEGESRAARISGDGARVVFSSDAPIFEDDPDRPADLYRMPISGGPIERIGALRRGAPSAFAGSASASGVSVDTSGDVVAFSGVGDFTERNPDGLPEVWVVNRLADRHIEVSSTSPTVVYFTHESGPIRYDVVRGRVSSLAFAGPGAVDLGTVVCLEDDSPDPNTEGFGDAATPEPGEAFFFVTRGSVGLDDGPGSYGTSSDARERQASGGDCAL